MTDFSWYPLEITDQPVYISWFNIEITSEYIPDVGGITSGQGRIPGIWGPITRPRFRKRIGAQVGVPSESRIASAFHITKPFESVLLGQSQLMKYVEFRMNAQRKQATYWLNVIRDEEDLLLSLSL